jgi:hypothetical protein
MVNTLMDGAVTAVAGQIRELAQRVTLLERNQRSGYNAQNMSIDGGALTINAPDGTPVFSVGAQSDGTFTARQVATIVPPAAPSQPVVSPGINGLYVAWDGLMATGATPPYDYAATQVHVSVQPNFTPSSATLAGHMTGAGLFGVGGLNPGTTYYVTFVVLNGVGDAGPPGAYSTGIPVSVPAGIPPGSISGLQIATGTITAQQIAAAAGILGSQIATGTITSANILAGTITAALLAAGLVVAGIVDATVITGSTLRNSATDPKTSINPDGSISITNLHGTVIFKIGPDGTVDWYSQGGQLLMELQPGGTQLIYASLTGPVGWSFEPPGPPAVLFSASSATSATSYSNAPGQATALGNCITVVASSSGTTASTGVTDSQNNVYTLIQSVTASPTMQVWQCVGAFPLGTSDTITVSYGTADTTEKNFIALATAGVLTASVTDFSAKANATSAAPSVSGTPSNYGDLMLFFLTDASAGGAPTGLADGWTQVAQQNVAGQQWTSVYSSANVTGFSQTASATITSAAWSAVLLALKASPAAPLLTNAIFGNNSNISVSTQWAADGVNSLRITHNNTTSGWGITTPAFTVQPGSTVSMQCQVYTPTALTAVAIGFTFWSGPNGTGSNLGTVSGDQGTLSTTAGAVNQVSITGASVPANAASATFFVLENAADAVNTAFHVDAIQVPGGLVYSNSPTGGKDKLGNTFEQGINFIGLPGLTAIFGIEDPYGNQLLAIDAGGNIQAQTVSATKDVVVGGQSLASFIANGSGALGLVNYGFIAVGTGWPSTPLGTTETALFELDQAVKANRIYEFVMNPTIVQQQTGAGSVHLKLHFTTDGSTPTTSSPTACEIASRIENTGTDASLGPLRCQFYPTADGTYRFLVSGWTGANTFQFKTDPNIRCAIYDLGPNTGQSNNNIIALGTGSSGGNSSQTYTEYFYPSDTWSYYSGSGQRNHDSSMYHGAYQGESDYQYSYIQWAQGTLGNNLNTVLNYSVSKVSLRLNNLHSWYNSGMTFGLHSSTSLGGGQGVYSTILTSAFISEGNTYDYVLASTVWAPFKAGGVTYMVLAPDSSHLHDLGWYGYFYGKGSNTSQPRLTVVYTH